MQLFLRYKLLEHDMIKLAGTKGQWLEDMMQERLGLAEWRVTEGGRFDAYGLGETRRVWARRERPEKFPLIKAIHCNDSSYFSLSIGS